MCEDVTDSPCLANSEGFLDQACKMTPMTNGMVWHDRPVEKEIWSLRSLCHEDTFPYPAESHQIPHGTGKGVPPVDQKELTSFLQAVIGKHTNGMMDSLQRKLADDLAGLLHPYLPGFGRRAVGSSESPLPDIHSKEVMPPLVLPLESVHMAGFTVELKPNWERKAGTIDEDKEKSPSTLKADISDADKVESPRELKADFSDADNVESPRTLKADFNDSLKVESPRLTDSHRQSVATEHVLDTGEEHPISKQLRHLDSGFTRPSRSSKDTRQSGAGTIRTVQQLLHQESSRSSRWGDAESHYGSHGTRDFFKEDGTVARIANSESFANITLVIIALNAVYLGADADHNPAETATQAHIGWLICDNFFCAFFTFEWLVRFGAYRRKLDCFRDLWFKFDTCLVIMIIFDTWITMIFLKGVNTGVPNSVMKCQRLLRLFRMARLMRCMPELVAMIKGVREASRAVGSALLMVVMLIYIFAIVMLMLMEDYMHNPILYDRFNSLPAVMWTLFMDGTLLDGVSITTREMIKERAFMGFLVLTLFILMSAMTVMNMLIGVLCEVVTAVAASEKEDEAIRLVKETVLTMLEKIDEDGSGRITKSEMLFVFEDEDSLNVLDDLKVDVIHFADYLDMLYESTNELKLPEILDLILMLRGDRTPTMKDILDGQNVQRWKLTNVMTTHKDEMVDRLTATNNEKHRGSRASFVQIPRPQLQKQKSRASRFIFSNPY